MKKGLILALGLLLALLPASSAQAAGSVSISLSGGGSFTGSSFSLSVVAGGFSGISGLSSVMFTVNYDSSKVQLSGLSALNGFNQTGSNPYALLHMGTVGSGSAIATLNFTRTGLASGQAVSISLTCSGATDQNVEDIACSGGSKSVTYSPPATPPPAEPPSNPSNPPTDSNSGGQSSSSSQNSNSSTSNNSTPKVDEPNAVTPDETVSDNPAVVTEEDNEIVESEPKSESEEKANPNNNAKVAVKKSSFWPIVLASIAGVIILIAAATIFLLTRKGRK